MNVKKNLVILAVLSFLLASCSMMSYVGLGGSDEPKPEEQPIQIVDFGLYEGGTLTMQTTSVPKQLGSTFGFRFKVVNPEGGAVNATIVTSSPGMINPEKNEVEFKSETTDSIEVGKEYNCTFTFEKEWEMVSGDWTLEVRTEDGATASKTFQVFNPKM
jgi:hypothetical protein